jgi:hypothetical protein
MTKYQIPDNALPAFTELSILSAEETEKKSSVMTDMRLLFNDELETAPACGVILHQLKIDYIENGEQKSFFLSMDKDDVTEMCNVLKRA